MKAFDIVILAAGKGERMVSDKPKVMHEIMGKPMIDYVVDVAIKLNPDNIIVVTGHGKEKVETHLKDTPVVCAVQSEQKGTAHALLSSARFLGGGDILVLYGDVPLIELATMQSFLIWTDHQQRRRDYRNKRRNRCVPRRTTDQGNQYWNLHSSTAILFVFTGNQRWEQKGRILSDGYL
jgi:bifunctional N-acetylglucosamine-1-phosphate-uridyltransferase/glucosamine-1-phosphate-acetyltransferase GlmU-like protein